jgi:L-lactate dehydrogenase (cytochrome)
MSIIQTVSSNASLSFASIIAAASPSQTLFFQLYKNGSDLLAEKRVREVEALGYKAIWLTVDALVPGNREDDIRVPWVLEEQNRASQRNESTDGLGDGIDFGGTAGAFVMNDDRDMTWDKACSIPHLSCW